MDRIPFQVNKRRLERNSDSEDNVPRKRERNTASLAAITAFSSHSSHSNASNNSTSFSVQRPVRERTLRSAYSRWLHVNHGATYRKIVKEQRSRVHAAHFKDTLHLCSHLEPTREPLVGIVGAGFAGLFAGLILQSLGIECEVFESANRVGGRIYTWYSSEHNPNDPNKAALYGEVGGMRVPQYSADMLPVQQLGLSVNAVLERNHLHDKMVMWRRFYYDSPEQRMRYNNMPTFTTNRTSGPNTFNFDVANGGDVPEVWFRATANGMPIKGIMEKVNTPFTKAIDKSFSDGLNLLLRYDKYSMWDYLTMVFTLGDLEELYDPAMGAKSDLLPFSVASFLETTSVGTGMFSVSFAEMVIAAYDWGGSHNPYTPDDQDTIYMLTVDQGMQRFPDACHTVLNLKKGVLLEDGRRAQVQVGMEKDHNNQFSYTAPNIVPDVPNAAAPMDVDRNMPLAGGVQTKERVFLNHKVVEMTHEDHLYENHGGMKLKIRNLSDNGRIIEKHYPYVISTLPLGNYLNGELHSDLLNNISFAKAQAIREIHYEPAFKAFLTFKKQFWAELGRRPVGGLGYASTDRPGRQIIYPSYGYTSEPGVLQVYCWAADAERLGPLSDKERIRECLKMIEYLYPDGNVLENFAGYDDGENTKTWFWDSHSGGGAFALYAADQYSHLYGKMLTPEFNGCLNFAGEAVSVHNGWIVGALDSAYNAVYHILQQANADEKIEQMKQTWGKFAPPDIAVDEETVNKMNYAWMYNEVDRRASSIAPGNVESIYGHSPYVFNGNVPAFILDYNTVPQSIKKTLQDDKVLQMLNKLWNDNVDQRNKMNVNNQIGLNMGQSAVEQLEDIYYGNNFQAIPKPHFWLKSDDEFARQQLGGFMPNLLQKVDATRLQQLITHAKIRNINALNLNDVKYVADYRQYLKVCTVTPVAYYLAKPIVFFTVTNQNELMPIGIQLDEEGELFTPTMPNAENAWLLAKMQTNCAGQTLHDVGFHQLYTHQICAMVSIALFSEEVFNPRTNPNSPEPFQEHPVCKLLRPHVIKTVEFQQSIYNSSYNPYIQNFPDTRETNGQNGVYNLGFVYDLIFSCGRIGNYQLQDKMYNDDGNFRFLNLAIPKDAENRDVLNTPFSYAYVHDASLWYTAIEGFVSNFVDTVYHGGDAAVFEDIQLQRFFHKLIPAFNHLEGRVIVQAERFPNSIHTTTALKEVLTMFIWQFTVQHTVVNDGAYNHAAFVPNASTLMFPLPKSNSSDWTPYDVIACLPPQHITYPDLGHMTFMDVQINASVTGQGPYPETMIGRGVLEPSIDFLQDTYNFADQGLRDLVDKFYQEIREVGDAIQQRQVRDIAHYLQTHPGERRVPETVVFNLLSPANVMTTIQT
jgi:monoamine oxidase